MDKMRERFEAAIKRPPGVFWNEASGEYDGSQSYYAQLAETYQAAWDAWQAALSQAEPVEKTFGEGIDVSYQDLFSQWQADHELQLKTEKPAPLPQPVASDVEEFIAAHDYDKEDMCSGCVPSSALREWMAGHARVPVEPTHSMGIAGNAILPSCVNSDEVYKAMLAASQQEGV